jgi:predicted amidohydrolase YtcJ
MGGVSRDRAKAVLLLLLAVFFSAVLSVAVDGGQGDGTLAFLNGTVITMDDDLPVAEAVLIRDGLIIAVGSDDEISILAGDEADVIDLHGRTLLPGFIDAHSHWLNDLFEVDSIEEAIDMSIRHGWTTISSLFTYPELIDELLALDAQGEIRNRVNLYLRLSWQDQRWTDWYTDYPPGEMLTPMIRVAGVKMFADGGPGSATAAFSEPYPDDPNNYGSLFFTREELGQLVNETHDSGYQIAIHAIGDAAIEQVLNAYEAVLGDESNEKYRHRIEHVLFLTDDLIQRMASKRIIASFQNHWATSDYYDWYVDIVGAERISLLARWRDLLDSGVPSSASTDYPYCTYGATAVHGLFSSVTRMGPFWGLEPSDSLLAQRLSVEEALRLITIDAAYATFQENTTGSITPGKYADLVVLSDNPLEVQPEELIDLTVWMTVVGGNIEYWRENPGTFTLSVDVDGQGSTQLPPGIYGYPSDFTLNLDALPGSPTTDDAEFSYWLLDGENVGSMDSISVTMDSDHELTAVFVGMSAPEPELEPFPPPLPPLPPILSNLTITPAEIESGDEVTIGIDIENNDSQSFTYIVTMQIGELTLLIDVELEAYESKTVSRTITHDIPGDYIVTVDGLTGSFTVKAPPKPAEFEFSSLRIFYPGVTPPEVKAGQTVTVTVSIEAENVGELEGGRTVELKVDGEMIDSKGVTLEGGASATVLFELTRGEGTYEVEVEGFTDSFTVNQEPSFWDKIPGFPYKSIVFGLVTAVFVLWMLSRSKKTILSPRNHTSSFS